MTDLAITQTARARRERIRLGMHSFIATRKDIADAYRERDWETLGHDSWEAYIEADFSESRIRLSADERRDAVAELRMAGMSQRAIGTALGVSASTVNSDLSTVQNRTVEPERVISLDGRERPATQPPRTQTPGPVAKAQPADPGATNQLDAAIEEFPELEHFRDRPREATAIAAQLRAFDPAERTQRREILAKVIKAEQEGRLDAKPDPAAPLIDRADRVFVALNEAARAAERAGGEQAIAAALGHVDAMQIDLWRDQFTSLGELCHRLAEACRPKLRRVQ